MSISTEDAEFLQNIVRDFWIPAYLEAMPDSEKDILKESIESGAVKEVLVSIPVWCLYRFLHEEGYASKLVLRKRQLWAKDRFGDVDPDAWFKELKQFIQKRIERLEGSCRNHPAYCWDAARRHSCEHILQYNDADFLFLQIDSYIDALTFQDDDDEIDDEPLDGVEFEHHVARVLIRNGWSVRHTGRSGDQGVDILAEKDSRKYAIQCKFSSYPVSNSAIQEAHAGRCFYGVQFAAVVTNADFTRSARQLAASVGVDLLNVIEIVDL